jgi:hypothetical protein
VIDGLSPQMEQSDMWITCGYSILVNFENGSSPILSESLLGFVHEHLFTGALALMVTCVHGELKYPMLIGK